MDLMIVEDEKATLIGLSAILDWKQFGIENVYLASNGEQGIEKAREYHPEIVLTDIRMPRMDGIVMAEKIRRFLPQTQIIFLSAYQELDYYKAAIRLKAVNYVEKPVMPEEMEKVLKEAIANIHKNHLLQKESGDKEKRIRDEIARQLLIPGSSLTVEQQSYLKKEKLLDTIKNGYVTTVLIWMHMESDDNHLPEAILQAPEKLAKLLHIHFIGLIHEHNTLAVHFISTQSELFRQNQKQFLNAFQEIFKTNSDCSYYITVGQTAHGYDQAFASWQSAVILLQEIFYFPYGTVRLYEDQEKAGQLPKNHDADYSSLKEALLYAITQRSREDILEQEAALAETLKKDCSMLPVNVRNMYSVFFNSLDRQAELLHISIEDRDLVPEIWTQKFTWVNLDTLHAMFLRKTETLFAAMEKSAGQQSVVRQIHEYIEKNYSNDLLSLKEISEYIHMSTSHMCTYYKQETGSTINQYLTQIRLDKARYYLASTSYSVADIAAMTGYRESSYFGRIFKKNYNLTPAEYRSQCKELNGSSTKKSK